MEITSKWDNFIKEVGNLIFFWIVGILFFTIYRTLFIIIYSKALGNEVSLLDYLETFYMGFRFDCTAVGYFLAVPALCTLALSPFGLFTFIRRMRVVWQYLFVILSVVICVITLNYYYEYNDQFNMFLFLGIYDDQSAILQTIWDYYHPLLNISACIFFSILGIYIFSRFANKNRLANWLSKIKGLFPKILLVTALIACIIFTLRGSIIRRPATRVKAVVTRNNLLNKTIINPYRSFIYAYSDFKKVNQVKGSNPYGDNWDSFEEQTVSSTIMKKAAGDTIQKPKQIFLVIMESYCSWSLMDKYSSLGVANNLSEIAKEGTCFLNFLPSYNATIYAYTTTTTSIPHAGINISRLATNSDAYASSIFNQFKKLGYKTNFFYGGSYGWENIGMLTEHLGCENVYTFSEDNDGEGVGIWGLDDDRLFDVVLEKINPEEYTFNLILTVSNHTPYHVDVYGKGYKYNSEKDLPEDAQKLYGTGMNLRELGHIWYGDWAIGQFMDVAKTKYPDALFSFTGDHYGRRFITSNPNLYETSTVPFILYGKNIPAQKLETPGSHMDIIPTLIELVAPKDFTYYSFGTSMFEPNKKIGIGYEKVVNNDSLYYMPIEGDISSINLKDFKETNLANMKDQKQYNDMLRLAWHYVVKGDSINTKQTKDKNATN